MRDSQLKDIILHKQEQEQKERRRQEELCAQQQKAAQERAAQKLKAEQLAVQKLKERKAQQQEAFKKEIRTFEEHLFSLPTDNVVSCYNDANDADNEFPINDVIKDLISSRDKISSLFFWHVQQQFRSCRKISLYKKSFRETNS